MSGLAPVITGAASRLLDLTLLHDQPPGRVIDAISPTRGAGTAMGLVAHVTISEESEDELEITQHPVEQGAQISDHAFKRPAVLRMQLGWTNSGVWRPVWDVPGGGLPLSIVSRFADIISNFTDVRGIYQRILQLQGQRDPFVIYTGKRVYPDMLVASVRTTTDEKTETSFIADITFRQVILVKTQVATADQFSAVTNPDPKLQGNPKQNAPSKPTGEVPTLPTSYSGASDIPGAI